METFDTALIKELCHLGKKKLSIKLSMFFIHGNDNGINEHHMRLLSEVFYVKRLNSAHLLGGTFDLS